MPRRAAADPSDRRRSGEQAGFDLDHDVSWPVGESGSLGHRDSQGFRRRREPGTDRGGEDPLVNEDSFSTARLVPESRGRCSRVVRSRAGRRCHHRAIAACFAARQR
ncbi:MAG TPA: hypothetical protein PLU22_04155 [Polyangiaceae bacterium]|nr:hypothetical protein [Polyangiaceae bacterium]